MKLTLLISFLLSTIILLPTQVKANLETYLLESYLTISKTSNDVKPLIKTEKLKSKNKFQTIKKFKKDENEYEDEENLKTRIMIRHNEKKVFFYGHSYDLYLPSDLLVFDVEGNNLFWKGENIGTISEKSILFKIKVKIGNRFFDNSLAFTNIDYTNSFKLEQQIKESNSIIYQTGIFENYSETPKKIISKGGTKLDENFLMRFNNKFFSGKSLYTDYDGELYTAEDTIGFVNLDNYFLIYDQDDSFDLFPDYSLNIFYKANDHMILLGEWGVGTKSILNDKYIYIYYNNEDSTHSQKINLRINSIDRLLYNAKSIHNASQSYEMTTGNLPVIK